MNFQIFLSYVKKIMLWLFIILALFVIYTAISFFFGDTWGSLGVKKVISIFWYLFKKAFFLTIPSLMLPILIYILLQWTIKNSYLRVIAGIGSLYIFYIINGGLSFSAPIQSLKLAFQVYFLTVLVMPHEMMSFIGAVTCMIGSIIIDFFPDLPGSFDDLGAICTLISMVFMYVNTLATLIKRQIGERIRKFSSKTNESPSQKH